MGLFKDCGCGCGGAKAQQKFLISVMSALVFFVISNPNTYRLTRSIFGKWVVWSNWLPNHPWSRSSHGRVCSHHVGHDEHKEGRIRR